MDVYLIDRTYELFRHFYAVPSSREADGGFKRMLQHRDGIEKRYLALTRGASADPSRSGAQSTFDASPGTADAAGGTPT